MRLLLLSALAMVLTGCAAGPEFRTDFDRTVDFTDYETYGFMDELGTDTAGYSSLLTRHFKTSVRREMDALGYRYTDENPDLLINFFATVEDVESVRSRPSPAVGLSYYDYRLGMYGTFPMYRNDIQTVRYKQGTANVDLVDADENRLVWEGVAEGRLSREAMSNPAAAVDTAVRGMFELFPRPSSE